MDVIRAIIRRCGGFDAVASATDAGKWAVQKWPYNGIPEKHWSALRGLDATLTIEEIHLANEALRNGPTGERGAAA